MVHKTYYISHILKIRLKLLTNTHYVSILFKNNYKFKNKIYINILT